MADQQKFDVIIIGAGPAGAATAISLQNSGLSVALLDKAIFPRDKICGDALSVDVLNQLKILSPMLAQAFESFDDKASSYGVSIFSPEGNRIDIPFYYNGQKANGYILQRTDFDHLLVRQMTNISNVTFIENCTVYSIENHKDRIEIKSSKGIFSSDIVVGSDGAHSLAAKQLQNAKPDKNHYSAGLRIYYEGVSSFHPENFIELHFFKDVLPGYLWIFPLANNRANVGIGMLSSVISRKRINLREVLERLISSDERLKDRFRFAKPLESVKGFGLPLGSKQRSLSGDRYLLTGDAASLIDPFSGEGIANAIRSGRIAASHLINCFQKKDFSASFNSAYDAEVYRRMWSELQLSRRMQRLCRYQFLFNLVVRKAKHNPRIHQFLIDSLSNIHQKKFLTEPMFYYRMLFQS